MYFNTKKLFKMQPLKPINAATPCAHPPPNDTGKKIKGRKNRLLNLCLTKQVTSRSED
jgi:hypothetical protein